MSDLEARIARLEAESDIRKLKARYLNACDAKDVDQIRGCFTADAVIDFPPLGEFNVDGLIGIFTEMAVKTPITDVHHGHNGEIDIDGDTASARWNLGYVNYDPRGGTFRLLANFYADKYVKTADGWRISYSKAIQRAVVTGQIDEDVKAEWVPLPGA